MLHSKFKQGVFIPIIIAFIFFAGLILFIIIFTRDGSNPLVAIITLPVCIFFLVWIIRGELRTKAVKVSINEERIQVRRYLGYGAPVEYWFSEIEGIKLALLPSEYRDYELLSLIKGGRKIAKISEYYHANYFELKGKISVKCKELKLENDNLLQKSRKSEDKKQQFTKL